MIKKQFPRVSTVILRLVIVILVLGVCFALGKYSTHAATPAQSGSSYRVYANADSTAPGSPFATVDTAAQLPDKGVSFRLRVGVTARTDSPIYITMNPGSAHSCAIVGSGVAYCAGLNGSGQLGNASTTTSAYLLPVDTSSVLSGKTVTDISTNDAASNPFSCAVASGLAYCWGDNNFGQLGAGQSAAALDHSASPIAVNTSGVLSGKTVTAIAVGDNHACAIASGQAYCWGSGGNGRLGNNSSTTTTSPVAVTTTGVLSGKTLTQIAVGTAHSCAIASGQAYCWGLNSTGQLGNSSTSQASVPVAVTTTGVLSGKTITDISAGGNDSCAVASDARAYCWGSNNNGQLGNNVSNTSSSVATAVYVGGDMAGKDISDIALGTLNGCTVSTDGAAYCWGVRTNDALGDGTTGSLSRVPVPVITTGKKVTKIQLGQTNGCFLASDQPYCWGYNPNGGLGTGSSATVTTPTLVASTNVVGNGVTLAANTTSYKLQFAVRSAASCSVQSTGFSDVTTTSAIAWNINSSVTSGSSISSTSNDPTSPASTVYQTYQSNTGPFSNPNTITPGTTGLWDFSLKDNGAVSNTHYCIKIVNSDGTTIAAYSQYPEVITANPGALSLNIVDGNGTQLANPSFGLTTTIVSPTCQSSSGTFGDTSQRLRIINNTATNGWSVSIAASNGSTSLWAPVDNSAHYDYNDPSGSPAGCNSGSDGDGYAGQLSFDPSLSSAQSSPQSGCTNTGMSFGSAAGFIQDTTNAITLISASSASQVSCYWDITGIGVAQRIPANQTAGLYVIDLTATVVAQ